MTLFIYICIPVAVIKAGYPAADGAVQRRLPNAHHLAATHVVFDVVAVVPRRGCMFHLGVNQFSLVDGIVPVLSAERAENIDD